MGRSHKETNTYRFQNFSERIALMNIDVVHQIKKKTEDEDTGEEWTYFGNALANWVDLNCTQHFVEFQQDLASFPCSSYVQLVHHAENIVATLKKHLMVPNTLALEPLLDLVVQLGRDMGPDFYVHFRQLFDILVQLLTAHAKHPDTLEKVFCTMAFLYKFLWRYLLSDIYSVYGFFSCLLTPDYRDYIQKFAAESFAFLMRKVKDHDALLNFLFLDLKEHPQKMAGVGQLLFEMMKGVKQHFHSLADKVFVCILRKLGEPQGGCGGQEMPWEHVEEAVTHMMKACAAYTSRDQAQQMWTTLLSVLADVHQQCTQGEQEERASHVDHLRRLLRVCTVWLAHGEGSIVSDPAAVLKRLCALLKQLPSPAASVAREVLMAVSTLLLHCSDHLSVEDTARLLSLVFCSEFPLDAIREFSLSLLPSPLFEKDVLPGHLAFTSHTFESASGLERAAMLELVGDFVLQKMDVPQDGSQLEHLCKYPLDFSRMHRGHESAFLQYLQPVAREREEAGISTPTLSTLSELLAALVCLPHVSILDASTKSSTIVSAWKHLHTILPQVADATKEAVLFVMHHAVLSLLVLRSEVNVLQLLAFQDIIAVLRSHPSSISVLHSTDLYLSLVADLESCDLLTPDLLEEIYPLLEPNLVSPSHKVRLLTLHILTLFPVMMDVSVGQCDNGEVMSMFGVCLSAERVPLTVRDYRQRLLHLRKLDHALVHTVMPRGPFTKMPVLYLCGTLLCPMTLLWQPVCELIASHAHGMPREEFWNTFSPWLKMVTAKAVEAGGAEMAACPDDGASCSLLGKWMASTLHSERAPDYTSFRDLLWRAMSLFPDKCEPRSRDIVPLFLTFLEKEYYLNDLSVAPTQNIQTERAADDILDVTQDDAVVDEEEEEDGGEAEVEQSPAKDADEVQKKGVKSQLTEVKGGRGQGKSKRKSAVQSLLVHLQVFAKFISPRSLYQEATLRDIYFQFLEHKMGKVQKAAFDCIMTYKYKYLTPYRENFERLLDDKTFKTEVVLFSVDAESSEIRTEHRQQLLPVLMRIMYGKMLSKAGNETSGKRRADTRRSIVFRFLAGCSPDEMHYFLHLVFGPFTCFITDDPLTMVQRIFSQTDLTRVVPPKRMKGVLGALVVVMEKLGHLLSDNARSVLHLLLGVTATTNACLLHRTEVHPAVVAQLKSVRLLAFNRLIQFLGDFDKYQLTDGEVGAIMEAFVKPQLARLSLESKCQPSPLLRLFHSWSLNPRHFFLLRQEVGVQGESPLSAMFSLLVTPGLAPSVAAVVMTTVQNLLEAEEDAEQEPVRKKWKQDTSSRDTAALSEGVLMVRPFVPNLLTFLEGSVGSLGAQLDKDRKTRASKESLLELKILARVSTYIEDESQSVRLCSLLMPFLLGSTALHQDLEENTLESVLNLMKTVSDPRPFYRSLLPLFVSVERRQSRVLLCQILKVIGDKVPELRETADIVNKLNSWDAKRAEDPDYSVRLATFRSIIHQLKDGMHSLQLTANLLLPLIYNCLFFIKHFEDLSLRDNSTHCLVTIVQRLKVVTSDPELYKELVTGVLLPNIKKGLRSKEEAVRHELLAVLQALVLAYPEEREFVGLAGLSDTDIDSDFFENIRHIQLHKQTRALRRLSRYLHSHKLRADQHMGFFVPLLYSYLLDARYAKSGGLIDASVDLTCMICRQLPWEYYYQLLRLYLSHLPRHLDTQRTIIKVIVAILDAFHFDLSQSQFFISNKPKVVAEATREQGGNAVPEAPEASSDNQESTEDGETTTEASKDAEEELSELVVMAAEQTEEEASKMAEFSADRKDACPPGLATRIHRMVLQRLIPQLHKTLTQKVRSEEVHKLAGGKYAEDEEVLRVPIAMAMIKLLQKLPRGALQHKLPGIILRVCQFLKSRAQDIRMTARDTLVKAAQSLGAHYLPFIIKEMRSVLTRGYQCHVLSFSVHHLLRSMLTVLTPGDLDPALDDLHAVFQEELFGGVSEEKDVEGITAKLFEAKTIKGYLAYEIITQYLSPHSLGALVKPLKMILVKNYPLLTVAASNDSLRAWVVGGRVVLEKTHSQRTANKVRLVLQRISSGLIANTAVTIETMMVFIHTLTADNLPFLQEDKQSDKADPDSTPKPERPESCLLLPADIPRGGVKPKTSHKTTLDVLVEFGLLLLHSCLRKSMLKADNSTHLSLLDPLVPSLVQCLALKYVRVNCAAVRCLCWLLTFPLPALKKRMKAVAKEMFILLKNYASAGAARGDNQELVFTLFKAVTVLVKEVKHYKLSEEHLQVLLTFCEEDIHDHSRQATAFALIKAILHRRLNVNELHELMSTLENMAITAEAPHLRLQCRQVVLQYLLDYPLGKQLQKHLEFFLAQLSYELEDGRQSALDMLSAMFTTFPQHTLQQYAGLMFVPLSVTLINDESTKCRKMAALTIRSLLEKVDVQTRDTLFAIITKWLKDKQASHRKVGAQLCGVFVEVEGAHFERVRLSSVMPILLQCLDPLQLDSKGSGSEEQERDHLLFNLVTMFSKILRFTSILQADRWMQDTTHILEFIKEHLLYPHSWVRLVSCQVFGQVFAVAKQEGQEMPAFLVENTDTKMKQLVKQLLGQLQSPLLDEELASQVIKNLVFLARLFQKTDRDGQFSLGWMARQLAREANFEKINKTKMTVRRSHVFKWVAAVGVEFSAQNVQKILPTVLPALQREVEDAHPQDETLKALAVEVVEVLKRKVGVEDFSAVYSSAQQARQERKEARKIKRAADAVNTPEVAARKRMKKTKAKQEAKKRRIEQKKQRVKKSKLSIYHLSQE